MNVSVVGAAVSRRRDAMGWTQKELAQKAGVSGSYVCRLEAGFMHEVGLGRLHQIAVALKTSVFDLLQDAVEAACSLPVAA